MKQLLSIQKNRQERADLVGLKKLLRHSPFLASIGVDAAEIWPSKVCLQAYRPHWVMSTATQTRLTRRRQGWRYSGPDTEP